MIETFADSAVFDVTKRPLVDGGQYSYAYYALKYTRKDDGTFEFSDTTEVERVTSFQPKSTMSITKAKKKKADEDDEDDEEGLSKDAPPGWVTTSKSIWSGVV
jgi:hypothetical protein